MASLRSCLPCGGLQHSRRRGGKSKRRIVDTSSSDSGGSDASGRVKTEPFHTPRDGDVLRASDFDSHLPDPSVQWINAVMAKMWPGISEFVKNTLHNTVEPAIKKAMPRGLRGVHFVEACVGMRPLQFKCLCSRAISRHVFSQSKKDAQKTEMDVLRIELDVCYRGDSEIRLALGSVTVAVSQISILGKLIIEMPETTCKPPFFSGLAVYFAQVPKITMSWGGLLEALDWTIIKKKVEEVMRTQVCNLMVLPNRMSASLDRSEGRDVFRVIRPPPESILRLKVIEARRLKPADYTWMMQTGKSDPYALVSLGAQDFKTATVFTTLNPRWTNQVKDFFVDDTEEQVVEITLLDEDYATADDILGRAKVTVKDLIHEGDMWIDLEDDEGEQGQCYRLGSQVRLQARLLEVRLDQTLASRIPPKASDLTCVLFVGIYEAIDLPAVPKKETHWATVQVTGQPVESTPKCTRVEEEHEVSAAKKAGKLSLLLNAGVDTKTIAEVLDLDFEQVKEFIRQKELQEKQESEEKMKRQRSFSWFRPPFDISSLEQSNDIRVQWDKAFLFQLREPATTQVTFSVLTSANVDRKSKTGGREIGSNEFKVKHLLECAHNTFIGLLDLQGATMDLGAQLKVKMQLRVVTGTKEW